MSDRTATFYSAPSYVFRGAGFPVYSGSRRQRGGSILGALARNVLPALGKTALSQAIGLAGDVVSDVMKGRKVTDSLKSHGLRRLKKVGVAGIQAMTGKPSGPSSGKASGKRNAKVSRKRQLQRKRSQPARKRRRGLF